MSDAHTGQRLNPSPKPVLEIQRAPAGRKVSIRIEFRQCMGVDGRKRVTDTVRIIMHETSVAVALEERNHD